MNRIVQNYPVADLPEALREGFEANASVRLTMEVDGHVSPETKQPFSLEALYAKSRPTFSSIDEIVTHVRSLRAEWD